MQSRSKEREDLALQVEAMSEELEQRHIFGETNQRLKLALRLKRFMHLKQRLSLKETSITGGKNVIWPKKV